MAETQHPGVWNRMFAHLRCVMSNHMNTDHNFATAYKLIILKWSSAYMSDQQKWYHHFYWLGVPVLSIRFIWNIYSWEKRLYGNMPGEATVSAWHNDACNFRSVSPLRTPYLVPKDDAGSLLRYTEQTTVLFALHSKISCFKIVNKSR